MKNVLLSILLLSVLPLSAQQTYIETFEVRLHNLDVVVTDANGHTVNGLTKDDFIVLEEGVAQEITNFSESASSAGQVSAPGASAQPATQTAEPRPPRRFIFFVDDMTLHPASRAKLLKNATRLIEEAMEPGDRATIVRPFGEPQDLGSDKDAFVSALRKTLDENNTRVTTQAFQETLFLRQQLSYAMTRQESFAIRKQYADMARRRVEQRLGTIRAVVGSLARVEGKKVLVLITESLSAEPGREAFSIAEVMPQERSEIDPEVAQGLNPAYRDLRPVVDDLARTAAANGVTVYALQPDVPLDLLVPGSGADASRRTPRVAMPPDFFAQTLHNTETTMALFAEKTGGRWFRGDGAIDDAFRQVGSDLQSFYSLAYSAHGNEATRRVEVKIRNHPEYRVRTRTDVMERSTEREMEDLVVASLFYPREANELAVRAQAGLMKKDRNLFTVSIEALIPMEKLTFLEGADGKYHATFTVQYAAAGEKSDFTAGQERKQEIALTAEQFHTLAGKLFHYTSDLVVAPGSVRIAVGVLDETSKLTGFATLTVNAR